MVPQKNYLLKPITFSGPCKSNIAVQVRKPEIQTFLKTFLKTLQIISATYWNDLVLLFLNQISGTLVASDNPSDYSEDRSHWLRFHSVEKLSVNGGGTIDGNGNIWWQNSCKTNPKLVRYYITIFLSLIHISYSKANYSSVFSHLQPCTKAPTVCINCSLSLD